MEDHKFHNRPMHYMEVPGLKREHLCFSVYDAYEALKEVCDEPMADSKIASILVNISNSFYNIAGLCVRLAPQKDPGLRQMRSCLCGHEKFRLIDGGKIECEQCGIRDHLTNVFEVVAEAERELPADSARLINERLTRARDDIYRAAQELEVSDPSYRRLWEFARMVEDEKIALLRRCKECP